MHPVHIRDETRDECLWRPVHLGLHDADGDTDDWESRFLIDSMPHSPGLVVGEILEIGAALHIRQRFNDLPPSDRAAVRVWVDGFRARPPT